MPTSVQNGLGEKELNNGNNNYPAQFNQNDNPGNIMNPLPSRVVVVSDDEPLLPSSASYTQNQRSDNYISEPVSNTYYQGTNNGNGNYQSINQQPQSHHQAQGYQKLDVLLQGKQQQQAYQKAYQQPYQSTRDIYQGTNYPNQNRQTWPISGVESGSLPAWKSSYTPVSGEGECYSKCRPNCKEHVNGGSCKLSCKTACNIAPTCGKRSKIQYAGQTMVCGRRGYNSEQVISGFYANRPLSIDQLAGSSLP